MDTRLLQVFDQVSSCIDQGDIETALPILAGALCTVENVVVAHGLLRSHQLHSVLLEDPYTAQAFHKPRGYAGDAMVMDMIYDQVPPAGVTARGRDLFATTTAFPVAQAVRDRRKLSTELVEQTFARGGRICSIACGHMRELDNLTGRDLSNITAVDQDKLSVAFVRRRHPVGLDVQEMNVFAFLRQAIAKGDKYDLIYSLGFTDYCDPRAMNLLYRLMTRCLSDQGTIFVANFVPNHLAQGWLEVCLDWHLTYRDESAMRCHAEEHGLACELWRDDTGSVLYSRMKRMN
jgi:hypothetical protein